MGDIGYLQKLCEALSKKNDTILELNNKSSHYILSLKAYSLLKKGWVTLGPFHVLVFYKMDGRHWKGILIQIYVSV